LRLSRTHLRKAVQVAELRQDAEHVDENPPRVGRVVLRDLLGEGVEEVVMERLHVRRVLQVWPIWKE
jgi:hypothetical protein